MDSRCAKNLSGKTIAVDVEDNESIENVKAKVQKQEAMLQKQESSPSTKECIKQAFIMLMCSNVSVGSVMAAVYFLGHKNPLCHALIYGPIACMGFVMIRDKYAFKYVLSIFLAIVHGLAHVINPFLDEHVGVNKSVDVWQDQIVHLGQAVLFSSLFFKNSGPLFKCGAIAFVLANVLNVIAGYYCWGKACHNFYVWLSLAPSLSAGLHFATGTLFMTEHSVSKIGFMLQGTSSVMTYFLFKSSDDILKFFALCRFFEVYFIASHYVGFFYGRYNIYQQTQKVEKTLSNRLSGFMQVLGVIPTEISSISVDMLWNYFGADNRKMNRKIQ